jgi:hypothetical protein
VSPYRLYALSNIGSLLALLAYPFVLEPQLARQTQAEWWSLGLVLDAGLAAWCGAKVWRSSGEASAESPDDTEPRTPWLHKLLWFALPACGVMLLLAITNKLCQDIAVVPFLWVLPLGLYLLSFIISFDSPRWYHRAFWLPLLAVLLGLVLRNLYQAESHPDITPLATLYPRGDVHGLHGLPRRGLSPASRSQTADRLLPLALRGRRRRRALRRPRRPVRLPRLL